MIDPNEVICLFKKIYGDSEYCNIEYDEEQDAVIVYKNNLECWRVTLAQLLFEYIKRGIKND